MNNTPQTSDESAGDRSNNAAAREGNFTPFDVRNLGEGHVQVSPDIIPNTSAYTTTPTTQTNNQRRPPNTGTSVNVSPEMMGNDNGEGFYTPRTTANSPDFGGQGIARSSTSMTMNEEYQGSGNKGDKVCIN